MTIAAAPAVCTPNEVSCGSRLLKAGASTPPAPLQSLPSSDSGPSAG